MVNTAHYYVNRQIQISRHLINFNKLNEYVPDIEKSSYEKVKLLTNLFFNGSEIIFESQVPTESYLENKDSTQNLFESVLVFYGTIIFLFVAIPNLLSFVMYFYERHIDIPEQLEFNTR